MTHDNIRYIRHIKQWNQVEKKKRIPSTKNNEYNQTSNSKSTLIQMKKTIAICVCLSVSVVDKRATMNTFWFNCNDHGMPPHTQPPAIDVWKKKEKKNGRRTKQRRKKMKNETTRVFSRLGRSRILFNTFQLNCQLVNRHAHKHSQQSSTKLIKFVFAN